MTPTEIKPYSGLFIDNIWVPFPKDFKTVSFWEAQMYAIKAKSGTPHDHIIAEITEEAKSFGKTTVQK